MNPSRIAQVRLAGLRLIGSECLFLRDIIRRSRGLLWQTTSPLLARSIPKTHRHRIHGSFEALAPDYFFVTEPQCPGWEELAGSEPA
jgi:hypothetical protein